jgi:hypothetical protein
VPRRSRAARQRPDDVGLTRSTPVELNGAVSSSTAERGSSHVLRHGISWIPTTDGARRLTPAARGECGERVKASHQSALAACQAIGASDSLMATPLRRHDSLCRDHLSGTCKTTAKKTVGGDFHDYQHRHDRLGRNAIAT